MHQAQIQFLLKLFIVLLGFSVVAGCSSSNASVTGTEYPVFEQKTLEELNYARTDPDGYAEARLKSDYDAKTDNGAYLDMKQRPEVGQLALQSELCTAARNYAAYLAQKNVFGHYAQGTPESRCQTAGYSYFSGENIAANGWDYCNAVSDPETAAIRFVQQLIIDQGQKNLGHRINIMNGVHKKLGIGFARNTNSDYVNYTVQDFGSY